MEQNLRNYLVITGGYWAFTITDGAIRMLVVLYFHLLGYTPLEVASLFLLYELCGVFTNLIGGWMGARIGLNRIMHMGMALQIFALAMLAVPDAWLSVIYVMLAQALSGIAKDLNKMSAKASVKTLVSDNQSSTLFKWVAALTGSKNALKGAGFFVGAALLQWLGFRGALLVLSGGLALVLVATWINLPTEIGKMARKPGFSQVVFQESRDQLAVRRPLFPVWIARCLVRSGIARISLRSPGLVIYRGGQFPRPLDHRVRPGSGLSAPPCCAGACMPHPAAEPPLWAHCCSRASPRASRWGSTLNCRHRAY